MALSDERGTRVADAGTRRSRKGADAGTRTAAVHCRTHLALYIHQMLLKSQLPHKIVNFFFYYMTIS
jgi:hypothetical protein